MKTLLSLLLLCVNFQLFAQNYQCLQYGPKNYFINGNGYVRGIRIDSVSFPGSDELYYPYHTQRISNYLSSIVVDTFGASWLGKSVTQNSDGVFLFDNLWDTVIIQTQTHKGDTWMFFNDTTVRYYMATVTSEDTMTIHGATDSIKIITIKADSAGISNPSDPIDNFQIILSKNNGFVQIFDLYTFPYRKPNTDNYSNFDYYLDLLLGNLGGGDGYYNHPPNITNSIFQRFDLHNPTMLEVYDFATGAVYEKKFAHYDISGFEYDRYTADSIITAVKSAYTTTYTGVTTDMVIITDHAVSPPAVSVSYFDPVPYTKVFDTMPLIDKRLMPEEGFLLSYYAKKPIGALSCDTAASYVFNDDYRGTGFGYNGTGLIPSYSYSTFSPGFGAVSSERFIASSQSQELTSYVYYSDGAKNCGTYILPGTNGILPVTHPEQAISISPNPASDHINISMAKQPGADVYISVYDVTGRKVYKSQWGKQNDLVINTSLWNSGLYMIIVQCGTDIVKKEKIIINK